MAHWRDSARKVRFFVIDYRACFPILFWLVHAKLWTAFLAIICVIFFAVIEHFGFSAPVFVRWLRSYIAGTRKIAQPWWKM